MLWHPSHSSGPSPFLLSTVVPIVHNLSLYFLLFSLVSSRPFFAISIFCPNFSSVFPGPKLREKFSSGTVRDVSILGALERSAATRFVAPAVPPPFCWF